MAAKVSPGALDRCDPIFANHLAFMNAHRGSVRWSGDHVLIDGRAPFLSSWTPLSPGAGIVQGAGAARLIPQGGSEWPARLKQAGYERAETLCYMELSASFQPFAPSSFADIRSVASGKDALAFASVQSAGFLDDAAEHRDWWVRCFEEAACENYQRNDQDLLIAWVSNRAAAVLLVVDGGGLAGIYAVATHPDHRRRGLSTDLLNEARRRARRRGAGTLVLQAVAGSYAHQFYGRRGFRERYRSELWRKPVSP